jgi:hypothetical protein
MTLYATPGVIEGVMTITLEPDGRLSFRVLVGAQSGRDGGCDMIELIISPEHIGHALAAARINALAAAKATDQPPAFPCHIGFSRNGA